MTLLENAQTPTTGPQERGAAPSWRGRVVAMCIALVTLAFLQDPGRIAADTKLDLTVSPWSFLGRSLHLWDPEGFFGQLQNQAYGYLWPMGPFFGLGQALGIPDWVVQRLWWSLILVAAFLGMYLLLRALRIGFGWPQILAGLAYALAVRPQTAIGAVSVEVWPMALAPWVLLPLVRASRQGNVVRAAALSALVVTTAGGVNAVAAGAVLPLAVWWLITLEAGPRRRQLAMWWSGLTALAILWWLIPLVILGKYSPPFLDWIESSEFTTSITDPVAVLRGADHWVAYLGSGSAWKAGWMLATYPVFIIATGLVAAAGMAGLAMRNLPHRAFLVGAAIAGLVLVTAGHTGVFSGLGSGQVQEFLDGAGAPLRNVHKFDLILRVPLVVGLCHLLSTVWPRGRRRWRIWVTTALVGSLIVTWLPALTGRLAQDRSYIALPDYWYEAAEWLNDKADPGRSLIVPGASFAQFVWGRTQDEPLQALGGYPWGVRDAVPLSSAGNIRMLDAVESRLEYGYPSDGLAAYLERMGVRYLVVRNDLTRSAQAPSPVRVHQALDNSLGIRRVAGFGPIVDRPDVSTTLLDEGSRVSYPAVEIYTVQASDEAPDPRVVLRPASETLSVAGGPEALLALEDSSALGNRPVVLSGDPQARALNAAEGIVTDTDRRREITFGYMRDNESPTMTDDQPYEQARPVHDYRVFGQAGTTAVTGGPQFGASSSASDVSAVLRTPRGATPAAAMDGALDTYWRPGEPSEQTYWEVRYPQAIELTDSLDVALMERGSRRNTTLPLVITTDNGSTQVDAAAVDDWQSLPVEAGSTTFVRVAGPSKEIPGSFGIREVRLPGEGTSELRMPAGSPGDGLLLTARPGDVGECVSQGATFICSDEFGSFSQDRPGLFRQVDLASALTTTPRIIAAPRDATTIADALRKVASVDVTASSVRTRTVAGSALSALDRTLGTAWQAAPDDPEPALTVTLPQTRTIRGIRLVNRVALNASSPLELRVDAAGRSFSGFTDSRGLFRFGPVDTDELTINFLSGNQVRSRSDLRETVLPVGVSELGLIGADDLRQPLPADAEVTMPCGSGPDVLVDGAVVARTSVTARVEQYRSGEALPVTSCTPEVTVPAGAHQVAVRSSEAFRPVIAAFAPERLFGPTNRPQSPEVLDWGSTARSVEVTASDRPQVLEVAENFNPGWQATVAGQSLEAVRVDGWKQAFVVPAGVGGVIDLQFVPDRAYRVGLLVGLVAVLAVLALALRPPRRPAHPPVTSRRLPRVVLALLGVGVLLVLGPWGAIAFVAAVVLIRRWHTPVVAFAGIAVAATISASVGLRPSWPWLVLQGVAVAVAWAAVAVGGMPRVGADGDRSGSTPATGVR